MEETPIVPTRDPEQPKRCEACGFGIELVYEPRCRLCGAELPPEAVTSRDRTSFAVAARRNRSVRRAMRRWVYSAGANRLRHLSLIRESKASAAFAHRHLIRLAAAFAIFELAHSGWHRVVRTVENSTILATEPTGLGWWSVAVAEGSPHRLGGVGMWWNPVRSGVALVGALGMGLVGAYGLLLILNAGATRVVGPTSRDEHRLRAAIHYSTSWAQWALYASLLVMLVPLMGVIEVFRVPFMPGPQVVYRIAALIVGLGAVLWWFWLVRLATMLPKEDRVRAMVYYAAVAPVLIGGLWYGVRVGLDRLLEFCWPLLNLGW